MWHVVGREEVRTGLLRRIMNKRGHLENLEVDGWTILKWILKNWNIAHGLGSSE